MAEIDNVKRIRSEDFPEEQHELVNQLGFILNRFMQQVSDAFNGQIDFNNLTQSISTVEVTVDDNGKPVSNTSFTVQGSTPIQGLVVINSQNITNKNNIPAHTPFITFTPQANVQQTTVKVDNISGLTAGNKYRLIILVIK